MIDAVSHVLREVSAQIVVPRFAALAPHELELKAPDEFVTIADREAEVAIGRAVTALMPGSRVIGEEACAADPGLLGHLGDGVVWLIDPIDGTANFAAGRPPFAMMVALLRDGQVVASWIYDPLNDRLAVAELGSGAWINGKRLNAERSRREIGELDGIVSGAFVPAGGEGLLDTIRSAVHSVQPTARCAGHEYPLVAAGARHFALYWRTLAWDHAPGALLLTEAGGTVTYLDGTPYRPCHSQAGLLLAHDPTTSRLLLDLVRDRGRARAAGH